MDAIDVSEWVLRIIGIVSESKRMDIRMSQCLSVKILFFLLWIVYGGQERFTGGYFGIYIAIWAFFHLYVIYVEMPYIRDGVNDSYRRKTIYKVVDLVQVTLLLLYFVIQVFVNNQQNQFYLLTTVSLFFDLGLNVDQIVKAIQKRQNNEVNHQRNLAAVNGGEGLFFFSIIIGCAGAFGITYYIYQHIIKQDDHDFPFYPAFLILCMIGEFLFIILIGVYLVQTHGVHFFGDTFAKTLLVFLYGISIGLFNFYYAIILAIYCIAKVIQIIAEAYANREREKVQNQE